MAATWLDPWTFLLELGGGVGEARDGREEKETLPIQFSLAK